MPREKLSYITVYASKSEITALQRAAERERRSLSNFVLMAGLQKAESVGVNTSDVVKPKRGRPRKK